MHKRFVNFLLNDLKAVFLYAPFLVLGMLLMNVYFVYAFLSILKSIGPTFVVQISSMGALFLSVYVGFIFVSPMEDERIHNVSEHIIASLPYKIETYILFKILSAVGLACIFISIYVFTLVAFTLSMSVSLWSYASIFVLAVISATAVASFFIIITMLLPRRWKQPIMFLSILFVVGSPALMRAKISIMLLYIIAATLFALSIALYLVFKRSLVERAIASD